jgi:hypothetical protein
MVGHLVGDIADIVAQPIESGDNFAYGVCRCVGFAEFIADVVFEIM